MKKKGYRAIPDFSTKRPVLPTSAAPQPKVQAAPLAHSPVGKPHATSKKSGRRGS